MALLNYTTRINPDRTVGEIQRALSAHGVSHVMIEFGPDRIASSISFVIETRFGPRPFRLPANIAAVEIVLKRQASRGKVPRRLACREQAARVGWRILLDWIRAQLAIVESGMVTIDQAMLAYLQTTPTQTLYESMVDRHLALPPPNGKTQ